MKKIPPRLELDILKTVAATMSYYKYNKNPNLKKTASEATETIIKLIEDKRYYDKA